MRVPYRTRPAPAIETLATPALRKSRAGCCAPGPRGSQFPQFDRAFAQFLLFALRVAGYHWLCAMFRPTGRDRIDTSSERAFVVERSAQLRRYLRPSFLVAFLLL